MFAASRVTVDQLETFVAAAHHKSDAAVANEIADLVLTQRLSSVRFERLQANLPGPRAKAALLVLADKSAFLDPPADEMPAKEKPDLATQKAMIALTVDYVKNTMHRLPNFLATRVTTAYERDSTSQKPLHQVDKTSMAVAYRDGNEQVLPRKPFRRGVGLTSSGEFGPILETALLDAVRGNLAWSHWEQEAPGLAAVFRYSVHTQESHYKVDNQPSAYRGTIAIEPSTGAILRIVLTTGLDSIDPLELADPLFRTANLSVEYGPVELGDRTYICPLRGVALSSGPDMMWTNERELTWLNDTVFGNYHLFRSNMRIVPDTGEVQ